MGEVDKFNDIFESINNINNIYNDERKKTLVILNYLYNKSNNIDTAISSIKKNQELEIQLINNRLDNIVVLINNLSNEIKNVQHNLDSIKINNKNKKERKNNKHILSTIKTIIVYPFVPTYKICVKLYNKISNKISNIHFYSKKNKINIEEEQRKKQLEEIRQRLSKYVK